MINTLKESGATRASILSEGTMVRSWSSDWQVASHHLTMSNLRNFLLEVKWHTTPEQD